MRAVLGTLRHVCAMSLQLAWSRFKAQNEGNYLGILWYLLDPLLLFTVILVAHGAAFSGTPIENFPVYLLVGLLMLHLFTKTTLASVRLVDSQRAFIKNTQVPYEVLVLAEVFQRVFMHAFEALVLVVVMLIFGGVFVGLLVYPLVLFLYVLFLVGASFILAPLGAYVRDVGNVWHPFTRLLLFATPIFYAVPPDYLTYQINLANPVFHFIEATRSFLIHGTTPPWYIMLGLVVFPVVTLAAGFMLFRRLKYTFAELV